MSEELDPYRTLQVDREADAEVIKAAYRRLARMYHPDVATDAESAARMSRINAAWELIGEPDARRKYDWSSTLRAGGSISNTRNVGSDPVRPASGRAAPGPAPAPPPVEQVSRDWGSGRSTTGGGYDASMKAGTAGPPPGRPSGSVLNFGRYAGWSLGEIARTDLEFIEWLDRTPIGRPYHDEIDLLLRKAGRRQSAEDESTERRGLFRRR